MNTHHEEEKGTESPRSFLLHQDICHYLKICSEIQISNSTTVLLKKTKRHFGEKLTVLDVIFKTTDQPPPG